MALRIPWDIEEAVLMLDMLLKSIDGKLTRKEAIRQVSEKLRRRAVNRGIEIDDIFRNENGITFQMSALEVAYTGIKTKLKQPTKLFVETVNLYRNHRELYEEILKEAENVVEPKSVQDEFCSYLSMQMPTFQLSDAYLMLSDIESFCLERKILQNKLFETTDLEAIKRVVQTVDSNRVFRFTYKQNLKKMSTVIHAYYAFLKSYKQIHRVSVQNYVEILNSCGIKVNQQRAQDKYYYLDDRTFDIPELKLMIDAVQASHFIPEDKTNELIDKLLTLTSDYNADRLRENIYFANKVKVPDSGNYVIVESISKAIHAGKKISFQYFEYDVNKNRVLRHDGKPYIISPYTMIWNGDYYYVVGFYDGRQEVNAFRVDRINACPEILPDDIVPIPEDFDPSKYSREVFRMYGTDEIVEVSLLCNSNLMMHVIDQFGIDVDTKPVDDEHFRAKVQIYPSPTFYRWVFGWGGKIKIESPSKIRKEYQTMLRDAIEMV